MGQIKQVVGGQVHLLSRGGGQAQHQTVEIAEDCAVFVVDGTMTFVGNNQVKTPDAVGLFVGVDKVEDGVVGRKDDVGVIVALVLCLFRDSANRGVRHILDEVAFGLLHQLLSVGQKQHIFHPIVALQNIDKANGAAGLARARGHHYQLLPVHFVERLANGSASFLYEVTVRNILLYLVVFDFLQIAPHYERMKFVFAVIAIHTAGGIASAILHHHLVAIGVEHHRPCTAIHPLQAIGVGLGLSRAFLLALRSALGLNHGERQTVFIKQHIVGPAVFPVGHPSHYNFGAHLAVCATAFGLGKLPSGFLQCRVDIDLSGFVLVEINRRFQFRLRRIDLALLDFLLVDHDFLFIGLTHLLCGLFGGSIISTVEARIFLVGAEEVHHLVGEVVQGFKRSHGVRLGDRLGMGSVVANLADKVDGAHHGVVHEVAELCILDEVEQPCASVIVAILGRVENLHHRFQGRPRLECRHLGHGHDILFGLAAKAVELAEDPSVVQKLKVHIRKVLQ